MKPFKQCQRRDVMTVLTGVSLLALFVGQSLVSSARAAAPPKITTDDTSLPRDDRPTVSYAAVMEKSLTKYR